MKTISTHVFKIKYFLFLCSRYVKKVLITFNNSLIFLFIIIKLFNYKGRKCEEKINKSKGNVMYMMIV